LTTARRVRFYEPFKRDIKKLRLAFYEDRAGPGLFVNFTAIRQVRCRGFLKSLGIEPGHYLAIKVKEKPLTLEVDFANRIGMPRRARNAKGAGE
jgi:hypothetical protein